MSPSLPEKREGTNAYRSWADGPESSWWDYVPGVSSFRGAMWDWEHGRFGWAVFEAGTGIADISLTVLSLGTAALAKQGGRMVSQNALHEATLQQVGRSMARMAIREAAIGGAAGTVMGGGLGYYQAGWGGMWRGAGNGLLHGAVSGAALSPFAWAANRAHSANRMLTLPASMDAELEAYQIAAREGRLVRVRTSALPRSNARTIWESRWGRIPQGYDVDHIIQRQHGGTTELSNLQLKLSGLNRSEGVSARWLMGNDRYGTVYTRVRLNRQP